MTTLTAVPAGLRYTLPPMSVEIARTLEPTLLNLVANHPDVRPWLGGAGVLDLAPLVSDPNNLTGVTEQGGFVAVSQGFGRYEIHSLFHPEGRGTAAIRAMRAALDYIFAASDAVELVTKVPKPNLAALGLARLAGFTCQFTRLAPWCSDGPPIETDFLSLTLDRWALRSAAALALGVWLHETMEAAKVALQSTLGPHSDDDETHDRFAGAAMLMVRAGNAGKAVAFYNQWATFAGYPLIRLVRDHPVVIDLEGMIVEARGEEMEVLSCR